MPLLLLLVLYLACLGPSWPKPPGLPESGIGVVAAMLLSCAAMGLTVIAVAVVTRRVRQRLHMDPQQREDVLRRYGSFRTYHALGLFVTYLMTLYVFGWGWAVQWLCEIAAPSYPEGKLLLPGAELLLLAPLLLTMVLSWVCYYDAERALHDTAHPLMLLRPFWSRSSYVAFHARQNLAMVLVPVILLIVLNGVYRLNTELFNHSWFQGVAFLVLVLLIGGLPWVLRLVLGLTPLPPGPLRDRLLAAAQRLNFRCSDIMLWNTRQGVANALVVGVIPALRYVVLSDRLIADLTPDEVEAVFGHEAGHVKHHHMLYYLGFLFVSLTVLYSAWEVVQPYVLSSKSSQDWITPLLVGSLGTYIFVVFGFLSRRCERQADIYGCRAVSCGRRDCENHDEVPLPAEGRGLCPTGIRIFVSALEKVAALNGISRSRPGWLQSWQHSTIDRRVQFLQEMAADPTLEPRFQKRVGLVKWALIIGLVGLLGLIKWWPADNSSTTGVASPPAAVQR